MKLPFLILTHPLHQMTQFFLIVFTLVLLYLFGDLPSWEVVSSLGLGAKIDNFTIYGGKSHASITHIGSIYYPPWRINNIVLSPDFAGEGSWPISPVVNNSHFSITSYIDMSSVGPYNPSEDISLGHKCPNSCGMAHGPIYH
ncbi:hypothetical protein BDZ94DRAFT_1242425, partial [Collybia nuda]